jgi:hypothetical protein
MGSASQTAIEQRTSDVVDESQGLVSDNAPAEQRVPDAKLRQQLMQEIGTLKLSRIQRGKLTFPINDAIAAIKPTGEVYVPGVHYRRLLNDVFGSGAWGLRPLSTVQLDLRTGDDKGRNIMYREYALVVNGKVASVVIGEAEYHPNNARLTWADAAEALRTNALSRACKDLGVFSEAWDPQWTAAWRRKHAVQVWLDKKARDSDKPQWRRLDADPFYNEANVVDDSPNAGAWVAQRARRRAGESETAERTAERPIAAQPVAQTVTQASPTAGQPKELITTARERKGRDGKVVFEIKTTTGTYFTSERELFDGAQAAARSQTPLVMVSETRHALTGDFRWLTEMHK